MKAWPLRWRIAIWSAFVSALALLTFTTVVAFNLYGEQVEMIDSRLAASAALVPEPDDRAIETLTTLVTARPHAHAEKALHGFALLRTSDGGLVRAEPATLAKGFGHWPPPPCFNVKLEGSRLRVAAVARGETTLLLAATLEPAEEAVRDLIGSAALAFPLVLLVVALGSGWIARRALEPIERITRAAELITAERLGERLPAPETRDEIGRHTDVLNGMFDRLQRGFEQANRFTADAAHELRTPLTIMRGQVENALQSGSVAPDQEQLLVDLLEEITGLQKISDNLLLLARFDAGRNPLVRSPFDLSGLIAEACEDAELLASPSGITVTTNVEAGVRINGDPVMLRRVALNLIDNAVKFNRPGGAVKLALRREDARAVWSVGNTGAGLPPERRAGLFERFYRPDAARDRDSGGNGLGLSLCREIVTAHGGRIELGRAESDWTEFTVNLPARE